MRRNYKIVQECMQRDSSDFRHEANYKRIDYPSRPFRARTLGYKHKPHVVLIRAKIKRGGVKTHSIVRGRSSSSKFAKAYSRHIGLLRILAQRVARKYKTLTVLNYYPVEKDGVYLYAQFILYDAAQVNKNIHKKLNLSCRSSPSWIFR